jgi:formylglycine-generating enzyme required for sulfatase activity
MNGIAQDMPQLFIKVLMKPQTPLRLSTVLFLGFLWGFAAAQTIGQQSLVHGLLWDIHEMSVGQVKTYAAATGFRSQAEQEGSGIIYEVGWVHKKGWSWKQPFGVPARDEEPAVHLTFGEAQAVCRHFNKRLPTDAEWVAAAYLEQRDQPALGFTRGKRYTYPHGDSAQASHCLQGCLSRQGMAPAGSLNRGNGHLPVMQTAPGVNGLYDMGGNVWEWVDSARGDERITRGGSWWYDASRQLESDIASKPVDTRVAYVGFRCVQTPATKTDKYPGG